MISKTELSVAGIAGVIAGSLVWAGYISMSWLLSKLMLLTVAAVVIAAVLVVLCLALNKALPVPPQKTSTDRIIGWGYWSGFVLVLFFVFHGPAPATASPVSVRPQVQRPAAAQAPVPSSTQCQPDWVCKGLNINTK